MKLESLDELHNRILAPSDRFRIARFLDSVGETKLYSTVLLADLLNWLLIWRENVDHSADSELVGSSIVSMIGSLMDAETSNDPDQLLRFYRDKHGELLDVATSLVPNRNSAALFFPSCVLAIMQSICLPRYWHWFENMNTLSNDPSFEDYDAGALLCMMHLFRTRNISILDPIGGELLGLDTCEGRDDVAEYWSIHIEQIEAHMKRTECERMEQLAEMMQTVRA